MSQPSLAHISLHFLTCFYRWAILFHSCCAIRIELSQLSNPLYLECQCPLSHFAEIKGQPGESRVFKEVKIWNQHSSPGEPTSGQWGFSSQARLSPQGERSKEAKVVSEQRLGTRKLGNRVKLTLESWQEYPFTANSSSLQARDSKGYRKQLDKCQSHKNAESSGRFLLMTISILPFPMADFVETVLF